MVVGGGLMVLILMPYIPHHRKGLQAWVVCTVRVQTICCPVFVAGRMARIGLLKLGFNCRDFDTLSAALSLVRLQSHLVIYCFLGILNILYRESSCQMDTILSRQSR